MATVLVSGALSTEALAGSYVMRNCDVPGYPNSPMYPWVPPDWVLHQVTIVDDCATGGGVGFTLGESRQEDTGSVAIALGAPTGPHSPVKLVKVVLWYSARLEASGRVLRFWSADYRADGSIHPGLSNEPPGSEYLVGEQQLSPDTAWFHAGLHCVLVPDEPGTCDAVNRVPLVIRGMEVTLSEEVPPFVQQSGGTMVEGGPQTGVRTLEYSASDPQSGLSKVEVLLGETVVASRDLAPRCRHADFAVCPTSDDETLEIDTRAVPNGSYDLSLRVRDAAGNEQVVHGERPIDVANESPVESSSVLPYALAAKFKGSPRSKLTVPYGRRVSVRGRLTHGSEFVGAGIPLEVMERPDRRGAVERSTRRVMTKADGSFSIGLATSRPSRVVRLAYRPAGGGQVVSQALKLRVMAGSRVRASLRGRVVRFSGRVLSGPIPKRGKRLQMEGRSPGSAWTPFKSLRTDKKGRFSGSYRLRVRRPGVVLKVRAVVPSESGYGYLSSRSRAVTLRVR